MPAQELRRLSAVTIPGGKGIGALSSQFLRQLASRMHELSPSDAARLSTLTLDLLTTALADALDTQDAVPPHIRRRALMAQIHAFSAICSGLTGDRRQASAPVARVAGRHECTP
ncbi:hypothetical protein ACFUTV_42815 [Streptomyces sp. NPDC057298]|uniref:hypothetical protein n=1 Tax=Streptomyces sp. NPDC057298 TaxID=3346091 RepID=UPI003626C95D